MTQVQRLNWKFRVKDVDLIVGLAQAGRTLEGIRDSIPWVSVPIRRNGRQVSHERVPVYLSEIQSICSESGVKVRALDLA